MIKIFIFFIVMYATNLFGIQEVALIKGKSFSVEKSKKKISIPGLFDYSSLLRAAPPCPSPLPDLPINGSVPQLNPTPVPGAFFPNPLAVNSLTAPPQTLGVNVIASHQGIDPEFEVEVPNTYGVIGLTQFLMGGNTGLVTFNRGGQRDGILDDEGATVTNLDGDASLFINNLASRIHYDRLANRFVIVQLSGDVNYGVFGNNGITIAVSDTGTISDATQWSVFTIYDLSAAPDSNGCASDVNAAGIHFEYPTIGIDSNAVYLSTSVYNNTTNAWITNNLLVLQKSSLYNPLIPVYITSFPIVTTTSVGGFAGDQQAYRTTSTLIPLDNFDDSNPSFGYAISQDPEFFGKLRLYRILNAGTQSPSIAAPIIFDVLQTFSDRSQASAYPNFLGQKYARLGRLEYIDDRLATSSHINGKQIYTAHAIYIDNTGVAGVGVPDRLGVRWYQLDVTGDPTGQGAGTETVTTIPALIQAGTLFDPALANPLYYNFPAITSNNQGDIVISGTVSGVTHPIAAFYVGKAGTEPKDGILNIGAVPPTTYAIGSGTFTRTLGLGNRAMNTTLDSGQIWGETSFSSLDPLDNKTIWTIQEIAQNGRATLVVAQLLAP